MNISLAGGTGHIDSQSIIELNKADPSLIFVDNFVNSQSEDIKRMTNMTTKEVLFIEIGFRNSEANERLFTDNKIDAVINFAGLKDVGESVVKPLEYYQNNMNGVFVRMT